MAVAAVAALDDDTRQALYAFVRAADQPVTREASAAAVGISRKLAAFHLDKLVDVGLLQSRIEALGMRRVGRTPKVYLPSGRDIAVRVPQREPEVLAEILVEAVVSLRGDERADAAVMRVAREHGFNAGAEERARVRPGRVGSERALSIAGGILARYGFEPVRDAHGIALRNCPFHPLAVAAPDLVCGLNRAFLHGVLEGLQADGSAEAVLAPREGACCVVLRAR